MSESGVLLSFHGSIVGLGMLCRHETNSKGVWRSVGAGDR